MNSLPTMTPQPGGLLARLKALLGSFFNLFALGGTNGGIIIRQKGGTAGTNEVQISHSGTITTIAIAPGAGSGNKLTLNVRDNAYQFSDGTSVGFQTGTNVRGGAVGVSSNGSIGFQDSTNSAAGTTDAYFTRLTTGVLKANTTSGGLGWVQSPAGRARLTADVTNVTTTMANLSFDNNKTLIAGRIYSGFILLTIDEALATDGFQLDLNGGTATMTNLRFGFVAALGATLGTRTSTALGTAITLTALTDTSDVAVLIFVSGTCNTAGTMIPRQAKNSDGGVGGGTLTTRSNSFFWLEDMPG